MRFLYLVGAVGILACEKPVFEPKSRLFSPAMISPSMLSYAACREISDLDSAKSEIKRARRETDGLKVIRESPESIVVGYSENAANYYFHKLESCRAYTEELEKLGWKKH